MDLGYLTRRTTGNLSTLDPARCALKLEDEDSWSYLDLHAVSNSYADALRTMGVGKGDRVGILLHNCLEYWALYFAAAKIGAIAVRLNFRLSTQEFEYILNDSGTEILCLHSSLADMIAPIVDSIPVREYVCLPQDGQTAPDWTTAWEVFEKGGSSANIDTETIASDPVMLMYTSGTTGRPKGALWSHDNTIWFTVMQQIKWAFDSNTVYMTTGPLYHVGGMEDLALPVMLVGGTAIFTRSGGFDIERVLSIIHREGVTDCLLFPFMIYEMLRLPDLDAYELSSLRRIFTGGDAVMPWAIEQLRSRLPSVGLVQIYGLTEGTPIATALDPLEVAEKGHTIGRPMPLTEIKVVDDQEEVVAVGEVGEICIKSPAVSVGYWCKPEQTAATFTNGWCRTGDLGMVDPEGYLSVAGRKKDMIRSGGENVYPAEIEDVLLRHPAVDDVAVIGIPDPMYIETVCAVIVPNAQSHPTEGEIIDYSTAHLASYKKPQKVVFAEELPRTPSGKIQKYLLKEKYGTNGGQ